MQCVGASERTIRLGTRATRDVCVCRKSREARVDLSWEQDLGGLSHTHLFTPLRMCQASLQSTVNHDHRVPGMAFVCACGSRFPTHPTSEMRLNTAIKGAVPPRSTSASRWGFGPLARDTPHLSLNPEPVTELLSSTNHASWMLSGWDDVQHVTSALHSLTTHSSPDNLHCWNTTDGTALR